MISRALIYMISEDSEKNCLRGENWKFFAWGGNHIVGGKALPGGAKGAVDTMTSISFHNFFF